MKQRSAMIALAIALATGAFAPRQASARNRWQDVIAPAAHGRGRLAPVSEAVERDLLEGPRASRPAPERTATRARLRAAEPSAPEPDYRAAASTSPVKVEKRIE